jgi:hypothetical protein
MSVPDDPFDFATLLRREAARNERTQSADSGAVAAAPSPQSDGEMVVPPLADTLAPNPVPLPRGTSLDQRKVAALTTMLASAYKRLTTLWPASFNAPDAPLFGIISGGAAFILIAGTVIISLVQHSGGAKLAAMSPQPVKASAVEETTPGAGLSHAPAPTPSRDIVEAETRIEGQGNPPESPAVVPASVKTLAAAENAPSELPKLATMYSQPPAAQPIPRPPTPPGPSTAQRGAPASRAATETTASLAPGTPPLEAKAARPEATPPRGDDASRRKRDQKPAKAVDTPNSPVPPTASGTPPSRTVTETTASLAPEAPPAETKAARADATPRGDDASRRKRDQKPAKAVETPTSPVPPTAPQGTSPSRATTETTASLAPGAPPAETKAAPRAETAQPHGDDAQNKRDQKAAERSSCSAGMFPGNGGASARAKPVDVQKMCADPRAPFTISVRCLVAAALCSDYPTEKPGKVAQKASAPNRAPSHPATDTKPETAPDPKPDTKSH